MSITRFGLDNRGTKACEHCGVLSWASRQDHESTGLICPACYDAAGYENEHLDGYHTDRVEAQCPTCNPERETRRLAKAAARVAKYSASAAARVERIATTEASYPHCANCRQRRPKTKAWERDHSIELFCSNCNDDKHWIAFYRDELHDESQAALYERSLNSRRERHSRGGN